MSLQFGLVAPALTPRSAVLGQLRTTARLAEHALTERVHIGGVLQLPPRPRRLLEIETAVNLEC